MATTSHCVVCVPGGAAPPPLNATLLNQPGLRHCSVAERLSSLAFTAFAIRSLWIEKSCPRSQTHIVVHFRISCSYNKLFTRGSKVDNFSASVPESGVCVYVQRGDCNSIQIVAVDAGGRDWIRFLLGVIRRPLGS